jgi:hypothetical protein
MKVYTIGLMLQLHMSWCFHIAIICNPKKIMHKDVKQWSSEVPKMWFKKKKTRRQSSQRKPMEIRKKENKIIKIPISTVVSGQGRFPPLSYSPKP